MRRDHRIPRPVKAPHQPAPPRPLLHLSQTEQHRQRELFLKGKGGRQEMFLPLLSAEEAGPAPKERPEERISAQPRRIRLRPPRLPFFCMVRKGKYQYRISARHRPAASLFQRGPAQGPGQRQPAPLRYQGPQKQAPAPPPDPHLIQAPPIIRADGPQPDPDPLLLQSERSASLHLPTLPQRLSLLPTPLFYPMPPVRKTCLPSALLPAASHFRPKVFDRLVRALPRVHRP